MKKPQLAIKIYERCRRLAAAAQRRDPDGDQSRRLDKTDEAKKHLQKLIADHPSDIDAIMALGNIQRGRKDFADCAQTYSRAWPRIAKPERAELADLLFPRHLL